MKIRIIVLFAIILGTLNVLVGCGPELIDCPDNPDGAATAQIGREEDGTLYAFGWVLVYYDETPKQQVDRPPFSAVNDFLVKKGYTPSVKGFIFNAEVIALGSDVDPYPMLKDLNNLPGVSEVYPLVLFKTSTLLHRSTLEGISLQSDEDRDSPSVGRAIIEVGRLEDGSLYEFGVVLVKYEEYDVMTMSLPNIYPWEAVKTFFRKKGYAPKVIDTIGGTYYDPLRPSFGYKVLHVGDCVDTALMLEELKAIPGVVDARLNQLHTLLDLALDKSGLIESGLIDERALW